MSIDLNKSSQRRRQQGDKPKDDSAGGGIGVDGIVEDPSSVVLSSAQTRAAYGKSCKHEMADHESFYNTAREFYEAGDLELAEVAISNAIKDASKGIVGLGICLLAADILFSQKKYDLSLDYRNQAIVLDPHNAGLYLDKFITAFYLGQNYASNERGSTEALIGILRATIVKAEKSGDSHTLARACSYLAILLFTRVRNQQTTAEARLLAHRATDIDRNLEGARRVLEVLGEEDAVVEQAKKEREHRQREADARRRKEEARRKAIEEVESVADGFQVLDIKPWAVLVLAKKDVTEMPFDSDIWEKSELRRWLNSNYWDSLPAKVKESANTKLGGLSARDYAQANFRREYYSGVIESRFIFKNSVRNIHVPEGHDKFAHPTHDKVFLLGAEDAIEYLGLKCNNKELESEQGYGFSRKRVRVEGGWWIDAPGYRYYDYSSWKADQAEYSIEADLEKCQFVKGDTLYIRGENKDRYVHAEDNLPRKVEKGIRPALLLDPKLLGVNLSELQKADEALKALSSKDVADEYIFYEDCDRSDLIDGFFGIDDTSQNDNHPEADNESFFGEISVGGFYEFGSQQWKVLTISDGKALLLAANIIEYRSFSTSSDIRRGSSINYDEDDYHQHSSEYYEDGGSWYELYPTWKTCSLRKYLNSEYIERRFSDEEQKQILTATIFTYQHQKKGITTQDRAFCLSVEEAEKYLGYCRSNDDMYEFGLLNKAIFFGLHDDYWWLRSPGTNEEVAACVSPKDKIEDDKLSIFAEEVGVRPAMWVRVDTQSIALTDLDALDADFIINDGQLQKYTGEELDVLVPNGVKAIADSAFENKFMVTTVNLPNGVERIGDSAFKVCSNLATISLPVSLKEIGKEAFSECIALDNISLPDGVQTIGDRAFDGCKMLSKIAIPDAIVLIANNTFSGCSNLSSVRLPKNLETIGACAFSNCKSLSSIDIPDSVTAIDSSAFSGCEKLAHIRFPSKLKVLGRKAFLYCVQLESVHITGEIGYWGNSVFERCRSLTTVTMPATPMSLNADPSNPRSAGLFANCSNLSTLVLPEGLTRIPDSAFANTSFTEIRLPSTLETIGSRAFALTRITKLVLPSSITSVGSGAFSGCRNLKEVEIPDSLTVLDSAIFSGCGKLESIKFPAGLKAIGESAFFGCGSLIEVELPEGIERIDKATFKQCKSLKSIRLPQSLQYLAPDAFTGCENLASICFLNNQKTISQEAFQGLTRLESVRFPPELRTIEKRAFKNCESLNNVVIPSQVAKIDDGAFEGCKHLTHIQIPDSVASFGANVFKDCDSLTDVITSDAYLLEKINVLSDTFRGTPARVSLLTRYLVICASQGICWHCNSDDLSIFGKCKVCGTKQKNIEGLFTVG
jgi:hypothetical protein